MKFFGIAMAVALAALLASTGHAEVRVAEFTPDQKVEAAKWVRASRRSLEAQLKDYPAARFRDVSAHYGVLEKTTPFVGFCGWINAKDGRGAYSGWQFFVLIGQGLDFYKPERYDVDAMRASGCIGPSMSPDVVSDIADWSGEIAYHDPK